MLCSAVQSSLVGITDIVLGRGDEEGLEVPSRLSVLIVMLSISAKLVFVVRQNPGQSESVGHVRGTYT